MKRLAAALATAIVMTLMAWTALSNPRPSQRAASDAGSDSGLPNSGFANGAEYQGATASIEGLLAAARDGDVDTYLKMFSGALRDRLTREADEIGRDVFARRLRLAGLARKSHAVFSPERDGDRADAVRITVESTFADRIERQEFRLERDQSGWAVTAIETARENVPTTPFGSLATYQEPEAPPVASRPDDSPSNEPDSE